MKKLSVVIDRDAKWLGISEFGNPVCSASENWDWQSVKDAMWELHRWVMFNDPSLENDDECS